MSVTISKPSGAHNCFVCDSGIREKKI